MPKHAEHRKAVALITASIAVLSLAGCAGSAAEGEEVTLTYALWDQKQEATAVKIADAFTAEHPNVTIDIQVTPSAQYWTKLQTAVTGGAAPDVFWMNGPNFQLYASNGVLAPMGDLIDGSDYPKSLVDLYTYGDDLYGAPKAFDTVAVWYNKDLFDAAGVPYPKAGWTWDDMAAAAAELTDPAAGVYGIAAPAFAQENYYNSIAQAGGFVISPDHEKSGYSSPEALKGVRFWLDLIDAGSSPTAQQMTDTSPEDMFLSGKVAMFQNGSWAATPYAENEDIAGRIDVAPLPAGPSGSISVLHGTANVANAKSSHVELAKEFAAFASGDEASEIVGESGTVIPAFNGRQQAWVDAHPEYDLQVYIDQVKDAVPFPVSMNTSVWVKEETDILSQVWAGAVAPEIGLKALAEKMQKALDEEQR